MRTFFRPLRPEQILLLSFLAISFLLLTADMFREPVRGFAGYRWLIDGLTGLMVVLGVWTYFGGVKGPATVFLILVFVALTVVAVLVNGVHSVTVTMFILLILISVPLLGWGIALALTLASLVCLWALAFFDIPIVLPSRLVQARNLTVIFVGVLLLVRWYGRQLQAVADRLRQTNVLLEQRVDERTRQILASERLATVGRLTADLAHELNTPLGALSSASASAVHELHSGLGRAIESLQTLGPNRRLFLESLMARILAESAPYRILSSTEARERKRALVQLGLDAGLPADRCSALAEVLHEFPPLTSGELGALGRDEGWKEDLATLETFHALKRSLEVVKLGTEKLGMVVRSFQRITHASADTPPAAVDPCAELENALTLLQGRIPSTVEVERSFEEGVLVWCRADRFGQVVINLITNALYAMDYRGTLELHLKREAPFAAIAIVDSGTGIPAEIRDRIFEPFFTTKPSGEGLGLGLDLARRLCLEEGGSLEVTSVPGRTEFTMKLPLAPGA
jgi:signal transduction histidine kinase